MTVWSTATVRWQLHVALITVSGLFIAITSAVAAPDASAPELEQRSFEQQIAAYHPARTTPTNQTSPAVSEREARNRIAEARRVLMELQAFIEETARTVELDNRLKIRKRENDQLKRTLSSSRSVRTMFESQAIPMERVLSVLTRTVVRNWLETVRLDYRVDEAERELIRTEKSWSEVEKRAAALRQTLNARRAEIQNLQMEIAALSDDLGDTRLEVTRANAEARLLKHQEGVITAATRALRRDVTSRLRRALLESRR